MQKTIDLMNDLIKAEENTDQLDQKLEKVQDLLEDTQEKLEVSKSVNRNLTKLKDSLDTASDLLSVVSIVPKIGAAANRAKKVIDTFNKSISKAKTVSDRIEKALKPLREVITKADKKAEELDHAILIINNKENQSISFLGDAQGCILSLPGGSVRDGLENNLDNTSAKIEPIVEQFDAVQTTMLKGINDVEKKLNSLSSDLNKLKAIDAAVKAAIRQLSPLISALRSLARAFRKTIRVPYSGNPKMCKRWGVPYPCGWKTVYFSFTIQQILNGVNGVIKPVMKELNKAMDAVLKPLLKALNLNIKLPAIPHINDLGNVFDNIEKLLNPIEGIVDGLSKQFKEYQKLMTQIEKKMNAVKDIYNKCTVAIKSAA